MPKTLADIERIETARENYRLTLRLNPQLSGRIVSHVDEGISLVDGMQPPIVRGDEVHLVHQLSKFAGAAADIQLEMIDLAREHLAEQTPSRPV